MTSPFDPVLDRQVWNMLHGRLSHLALSAGQGSIRMDRRYGPFAAVRERSSECLDEVAALIDGPDDEIWFVEPEELPPPPGTRQLRVAPLLQMIADGRDPVEDLPDADIVTLDEGDAPEMIALAHATKPGPWGDPTHCYTSSIGIRIDGRLAAMAGQRMLPAAGIAEVSGVCTWPEFRGQGLATRLIRRVMAGMQARGEVPYLHSYAENAGAIALYTSLGFRPRREMTVTVLALA